MLIKLFLILFMIGVAPVRVLGQRSDQRYDKSNGCISDTLLNTEFIHSKAEVIPLFKGNMRRFFIDNISIDMFLRYLPPKDSLFVDTARVRFIMSKNGEMSNISISKVRTPLFHAEVMHLLRLSSCNWQIGYRGGRFVNCWAQFDIYLRIVRRNGEVNINIDLRQFEPPTMPM